MSQNDEKSNEKKLERISIDSSEKYEAYSRFQNGVHKLADELSHINSLINKVNVQLYIIKRRKEMFNAKHQVISEYGKIVYEQQPPLIFLTPIIIDPIVNLPPVEKYYFDAITGNIRIDGEDSATQPSTPLSLNYDDDEEDQLLSNISDNQLLSQSRRQTPTVTNPNKKFKM